jgi:hypothetical protein
MDPSQPQPESPPPLKRRWMFHRTQALGVPLLAVLPLLAISGAFGPSTDKVHAQGNGLRIEAEAPTRMRYKTTERLRLRVTNLGDATARPTLFLEHAYLEAFTKVVAHPAPRAIQNGQLVFDVGPLAGGSTAEVAIQLEAEKYGRVPGFAALEGGPRVIFDTFVIP